MCSGRTTPRPAWSSTVQSCTFKPFATCPHGREQLDVHFRQHLLLVWIQTRFRFKQPMETPRTICPRMLLASACNRREEPLRHAAVACHPSPPGSRVFVGRLPQRCHRWQAHMEPYPPPPISQCCLHLHGQAWASYPHHLLWSGQTYRAHDVQDSQMADSRIALMT
jgi:hypothetical protein